MPTNISEAVAHKRVALDQANAHTTTLLASLIMALIVLILLFKVDGLAQTLMGEIEF
jgi:hypothetical protein